MFNKIKYGLAILGSVFLFGSAHAAPTGICTSTSGAAAANCDVIFTSLPTSPTACVSTFAPFIYTIKNTTPVPIKINYINILVADAFPAAVTSVDTSVANSCIVGGTIAPGATCNIQVDINSTPSITGNLNRVLQVGVNTRQIEVDAAITFPVCTAGGGGGGPIAFTGLDRLVLFAGGTLANGLFNQNLFAAVVGDIGTSPTTNISGFTLGAPPTGVLLGSIHPNDTVAQTFAVNLNSAVTTMNAAACDQSPAFSELSGQIITATQAGINTICFPAGNVTLTGIAGPVFLSNGGFSNVTFVLRITGNFTSSSVTTGPTVQLINVLSRNVFWDVGDSITLGGIAGILQGTFIAANNATITDLSVLIGRVFSSNGSVTLNNSLIGVTVNPNLI